MKILKKFAVHLNTVSFALLMSLPSSSQAASIESILERTIHYLQGGVARSIGIITIMAAGYLCLFKQRLPKETFVMILIGLGIVYGSTSLYNILIG